MSDTAITSRVSENSLELMLTKAIENKVPVETMERLLGMRRELRAEWAKGEFDKAMAEFQFECPVVKKTTQGYNYYYAKLEAIVEQTKELIHKHGFSYLTKTATEKETVKAICVVKHKCGHSEESPVEVPIGDGVKNKEGKDVMSEPQKVMAAITFAKRNAFCNAFGIFTGDEDIDAREEREKEETLKTETKKAIERLKSAQNISALTAVWTSLSGSVRQVEEVVQLKEKLKAKLTPKDESTKV